MRHFFALLSATLLALLTMAISGCQPLAEDSQASASSTSAGDHASVMTDSVNYMHERGMQYTLYDLSQTPPMAVGGAIVYMLATGGEKGCCLSLPRTWQPGMKVRVVWEESDHEHIYEKQSRDLEIPHYDEPADLYVVFHPKNEVELVVSAAEPGHPEWRGRIKKTPWEQCVESHGRKPCKAALPKQFDTGSAQGFCTYTQAKDFPKENYDGKDLCEFAMHECMTDYEDEPFCKGILWGARRK